ncbi:hypothetical protein CHS0354_042375 [Potamilus streckersoni]|uniref:Receptor ligand binding region domain-containing protein n=1 Tax=Potamilus streckersoni TaxID=2493646 RepID=A0AAE0W0Z0_9BIVA|nr:hypothetical protein CHS0354_042375 [Potamilus streckersoni]
MMLIGSINVAVHIVSFLYNVLPSQSVDVNIAAILPANDSRMFSMHHVSPAIEYAIEKLNRDTDLLEGHSLSVAYRDSKCSISHGINQAINFYIEQKVNVFFGPVCDYSVAPVARQSVFWNVPVISVGAMARDFATEKKEMYTLLTRVGPVNFRSLSSFIVETLRYHRLSVLKILYDKDGQGNIIEGFCTLATHAIHYDIKEFHKEITQDHFRLDQIADLSKMLIKEVGLDNPGKVEPLHFPYFFGDIR